MVSGPFGVVHNVQGISANRGMSIARRSISLLFMFPGKILREEKAVKVSVCNPRAGGEAQPLLSPHLLF